jgi:hypothetical protein
MQKRILAVTLFLIVVTGLIIAGIAIGALEEAPPQRESRDTAIAIFTSANQPTRAYRTEQHLPLNNWHQITVYGETFPACAILYEGADTILTVDPAESAVCGDL